MVDAVEEEIKQLLADFERALADVPYHLDFTVHRSTTMRKPKPKKDETFKEKFLSNAPARSMDYLLSEKKSW